MSETEFARAERYWRETCKLQSRVKDLEEYIQNATGCCMQNKQENARLRKVVEAARDCLWVDKCQCDVAYTGRGRHEPNSKCGELDPIREALRELGGDETETVKT